MTQEALKMALDALETELSIDWTNNDEFNASAEKMYEAIAAIKEALAQQEKDYERGFIGGMQKQMQSSVDKAVNRMAQPEQEPVADDFFKMIADKNPKPFLPPQRRWVGLTDEELEVLFQTAAGADEEVHIRFARAIESKLKEVNT